MVHDVRHKLCNFTVRIHSLLLAAGSPCLATMLRPHFSLCLEDDIRIILPDTDTEELEYFVRYIYGLEDQVKKDSLLFTFLTNPNLSKAGIYIFF